eukprot:TRINITY_DN14513_c0_g1_i5.p2 TRINITY_DN14513_c0_g1~~TRINITY_DN14513_c0_g1_i5.p2  ORF type:complete len:229 (-),score=-23.03 TRINITY_DN14513_c0_g1_i5:483-1169(-)
MLRKKKNAVILLASYLSQIITQLTHSKLKQVGKLFQVRITAHNIQFIILLQTQYLITPYLFLLIFIIYICFINKIFALILQLQLIRTEIKSFFNICAHTLSCQHKLIIPVVYIFFCTYNFSNYITSKKIAYTLDDLKYQYIALILGSQNEPGKKINKNLRFNKINNYFNTTNQCNVLNCKKILKYLVFQFYPQKPGKTTTYIKHVSFYFQLNNYNTALFYGLIERDIF